MSYIIVWRNSHRNPFLDVDGHGFLETYVNYETAKEVAEEVYKNENITKRSEWYFDYEIYEEATQ